MIQQPDINGATGLFDLPGDRLVIPTGLKLAAGMVMTDDNGHGIKHQGALDDLTGVDHGLIHRALEHDEGIDHGIAAI
ncbi:hypothetical protein ES705_10692 [subsurface metagenome]